MDKLHEFPLVYLATPYSKYPAGIEQAFIDASKVAANLMIAGVKVYSPIAHTHPLAVHGNVDPYDHSIWLPFDQAIMDAASACVVAMMPGWRQSKGTAHELEYFEKGGKPVFYYAPAAPLGEVQ